MIGFEWTAEKFFLFLFFMFVAILSYNYVAMAAAGLTPNVQVASIISFAIFPQWNLFSGFLVPETVSYYLGTIWMILLIFLYLSPHFHRLLYL